MADDEVLELRCWQHLQRFAEPPEPVPVGLVVMVHGRSYEDDVQTGDRVTVLAKVYDPWPR